VDHVRLLEDALWVTPAENGAVAVPVREGLLIPARADKKVRHSFDTYTYEGCHMQMMGLLKAGAAALVTWDDCYVRPEVATVEADGGPALGLSMALSKTARAIRLTFLGKGDYNTVAAAYRDVARARGLVVTWDEKLKGHADRERYFGAVNYKLWSMLTRRMNDESTKEESVKVNWTFEQAAQISEHLKNDLKLDRVLFTMGGWIHRGYDNQHPDILPAAPECGGDAAFADACRRIRECGYVLSLHDNYQDIYRDSPSWDEKYIMKRPDGGLSAGGKWAGGRAYLTCAKTALELAKRPQNLPAVRKLSGADSYFIDTTYAAGLQECFDKDHPLTRADDMRWKRALSDYAREVFGSFGSECGREWAVPHADFFEGMTGVSGGYYHNKGLLDSLGAVPVPLFEMVFRDCIALYGKYGYDIYKAAPYVLDHVLIGRPLNIHSVPQGLYWQDWKGGKPEPLHVAPQAAHVEVTGPRTLSITYRWQVEKPVAGEWRALVHFTDRAGAEIKFQNDHDPDTAAWKPGLATTGPFTVTVPQGLAGEFDVRVGLYSRPSLGRVNLLGESDGECRHTVGRLKVAADGVTFTPVTPKRTESAGDPAMFTRSDGGWAEGLHPVDVYVKNTYEVLAPLNVQTARVRMTRHEFLTPDRLVRRSVFGEGAEAVQVIVNLGRAPFACTTQTGGEVVLPAYGFVVDGPRLAAFVASKWGGLEYADPPLLVLESQDGKPLATSAKVRAYHGFGDARVRLSGKVHTVAKEAVLP
jgi:hypothetical protein